MSDQAPKAKPKIKFEASPVEWEARLTKAKGWPYAAIKLSTGHFINIVDHPEAPGHEAAKKQIENILRRFLGDETPTQFVDQVDMWVKFHVPTKFVFRIRGAGYTQLYPDVWLDLEWSE